MPKIQFNVTRSDAAAASATTQIAAPDRLPSQTATPIIKHSDANAVNQVSADIGFPAADAQRQRQLGRAEMPEVVIGELAGRADLRQTPD